MRSSAVLTLIGATLALASPVNHAHQALHEKRAIVYDYVTDVVTVTVTAGHIPTHSAVANTTVVVSHTVYLHPTPKTTSSNTNSSSSTFIPTPPPTISAAPPPPPPPPAPVAAPPAPVAPEPVAQPQVAAPAPQQQQQQAASSPPSSGLSGLAGTAVDSHNSCRASHGAPAMKFSAELAQYAANTASSCVFAHDMSQGSGGYGQNIAAQGSSNSDAWTGPSALQNAVVDAWYGEQSIFDSQGLYGQNSPSGSGDFLHFTQVVWKSSTDVGCAVQACPTDNAIFPGDYTWFTVCNYYPAGNVEGSFASNVS